MSLGLGVHAQLRVLCSGSHLAAVKLLARAGFPSEAQGGIDLGCTVQASGHQLANVWPTVPSHRLPFLPAPPRVRSDQHSSSPPCSVTPRVASSPLQELLCGRSAIWAVKEWLLRRKLLGRPPLRKNNSFLCDIFLYFFPSQTLPLPCLADML